MNLSIALEQRSEGKCELCGSANELQGYLAPPKTEEVDNHIVVACNICLAQLSGSQELEPNHWRCLNESMWSQVPAVQVVVYRLLKELSAESWAQDLIGMMYLDETTQEWAEQTVAGGILHKDSNGVILQAGDTVTLIKDLNVKGASFVAKRGTAVRRISLVHDNANHIQGKVNGQTIIILTQYVKKQ